MSSFAYLSTSTGRVLGNQILNRYVSTLLLRLRNQKLIYLLLKYLYKDFFCRYGILRLDFLYYCLKMVTSRRLPLSITFRWLSMSITFIIYLSLITYIGYLYWLPLTITYRYQLPFIDYPYRLLISITYIDYLSRLPLSISITYLL